MYYTVRVYKKMVTKSVNKYQKKCLKTFLKKFKSSITILKTIFIKNILLKSKMITSKY